jgi:hypothetical protein
MSRRNLKDKKTGGLDDKKTPQPVSLRDVLKTSEEYHVGVVATKTPRH